MKHTSESPCQRVYRQHALHESIAVAYSHFARRSKKKKTVFVLTLDAMAAKKWHNLNSGSPAKERKQLA